MQLSFITFIHMKKDLAGWLLSSFSHMTYEAMIIPTEVVALLAAGAADNAIGVG